MACTAIAWMYRALPHVSLWVVPGRGHAEAMRDIRDVFAPTVIRFFSDDWPMWRRRYRRPTEMDRVV